MLAIAAANMQLNISNLLSSSSVRPQPSEPNARPSVAEQPVWPATERAAAITAAALENGTVGMLGRSTPSLKDEHGDMESSEQVVSHAQPDRRQHKL